MFGSEVVTLRTTLEIVKRIQYKLCIMGVSINGPAYMFGDNMSVANGDYTPQWKIYKKRMGICYHAFREASAAGIRRVGFLKGKYNIVGNLTNILSGTAKEKQVQKWMWRKYIPWGI